MFVGFFVLWILIKIYFKLLFFYKFTQEYFWTKFLFKFSLLINVIDIQRYAKKYTRTSAFYRKLFVRENSTTSH